MRFDVLGPLTVRDDEFRPVSVRGTKQKLLLASLLCCPNQAVSAERLIDLIWPDDPPRTSRNSLQAYASRLRRSFGDKSRLVHTFAGYTLVVREGELDARCFEDLAADGRRAAAEGQPDKAADLFEQALSQWRGEAFAGLHEIEIVRNEAERLAEIRLATLADRLDADLALGRHTHVVAELARLVSQYPLRERFRRQLMLALYRSGRPADALQVYREGRHLLVDELGLEPGAELRSLEQAILREDPALDRPTADWHATHAAGSKPAELPSPVSTFTGRLDEIKRLRVLFRDAARDRAVVAAVHGVGGVGKSALVIQLAHALAEDFPDGQLYVNLRGATPGVTSLSPAEVLDRLLRALGAGLDVDDSQEAAARFRTITARRRLLVVLDDAASAAQVRPLLPSGKGCAALVTSREMLSVVDDAVHVHLDTFPEHESVELLSRLVGSDRTNADHKASGQIVRLCGHLPLAIRIVAARLAARPDWSLAKFANRLLNAQRRLDEFEYADLGVRTSFTLSLEQLRNGSRPGGTEAARLFELLGLLDTADISAPLAAALANDSIANAQTALDVLVDAKLVHVRSGDRYDMHDLIRLYARELAAELDPELGREAASRAMHCYLATVRSAMLVLLPGSTPRLAFGFPQDRLSNAGIDLRTPEQAVEWLDAEMDNLLAVTWQAIHSHDDGAGETLPLAFGLAVALNSLSALRHIWRELLPLNQAILHAAEQTADVSTVAMAHGDLGRALRFSGRLDEAVHHYNLALAGWREVGDLPKEADMLYCIGGIHERRQRIEDAAASYQRVFEIRRQLGDLSGQAHILNVLGLAEVRRAQYENALPYYQQSLAIFRKTSETWGEGMVLGNLADLYRRWGQPARACELFPPALEVIRESGDQAGEVELLWYFGEALWALGDRERARSRWEDALAKLVEMRELTAEEAREVMRSAVPTMPEQIRNWS